MINRSTLGLRCSAGQWQQLSDTAPVLFERWNHNPTLQHYTRLCLAGVDFPASLNALTGSPTQLQQQFRLWRNAWFAALTVRDIIEGLHPQDVAARWSEITENLLQWAWSRSFQTLDLAGWITERTVMFGFGKLGGGELNLSSDIDVAFFCDPPDENAYAEARPGIENALRAFLQLCSARTADGFGYRVDLRLRPQGAQGNLIDALDIAELYYRDLSAPWERLALLKWRPICGNLAVGHELQRRIEPVLFKKHLDYIIVEEIQQMRAKIARETQVRLSNQSDIKLGRGGIREAEFFTQSHQLLFGGRDASLRSPNQQQALTALVDAGILPLDQAQPLAQAYWLCRAIENRIQQRDDQQTHRYSRAELAQWDPTLRHLMLPGLSLEHTLDAAQTHIEECFASLARETDSQEPSVHRLTAALTSEVLLREEKLATLTGEQFHDPAQAMEHIQRLLSGPEERAYGRRTRAQFERLGMRLIDALWESPRPEQALENLVQFMHRVGGRAEIYALLNQNPHVIELLLRILSTSGQIADRLLAAPGLLDSQVARTSARASLTRDELLGSLPSQLDDTEQWLENLARWCSEQLLRVGVHTLGGALDGSTHTAQISDIAEVVLEQILQAAVGQTAPRFELDPAAWRQHIIPVALGRFGGREINFGSDLDMVFLRAESSDWSSEMIGRSLQRTTTWINSQTRWGRMFELDLRLRPGGATGPFSLPPSAFVDYHRSAQAWEQLPLCKARPLWDAQGSYRRTILDAMYAHPPVAQRLDELIAIRGRILSERGPKEPFKAGPGTILDFEFATNIALIHCGERSRAAIPTDFEAQATALSQWGWYSTSDSATVVRAMTLVRALHAATNLLHLPTRWGQISRDWPRLRTLFHELEHLGHPDELEAIPAIGQRLWERTIEAVKTGSYNIRL